MITRHIWFSLIRALVTFDGSTAEAILVLFQLNYPSQNKRVGTAVNKTQERVPWDIGETVNGLPTQAKALQNSFSTCNGRTMLSFAKNMRPPCLLYLYTANINSIDIRGRSLQG